MNKRFVGVLAFALVVSFVASFFVYRLIVAQISKAASAHEERIVVASRDLPVGTLIQASDVKPADWNGPVQKQWARNPNDVVGRGVVQAVYEGEPLAETRLAARGAGGGLAATIPAGKRAVAVRVNDVIGVGGFVVPGMRVDVLISGVPPQARQSPLGTQTRTILQNIEVLSAGQNIRKDAEGKPVTVTVVNLLVTPEQAEILSLATDEKKIQLVLRNPLDTVEVATKGTAEAFLFDGQPGTRPKDLQAGRPKIPYSKPAPPKPPVPVVQEVRTPIVMEMIHAGKRQDAKVGEHVEYRTVEPKK